MLIYDFPHAWYVEIDDYLYNDGNIENLLQNHTFNPSVWKILLLQQELALYIINMACKYVSTVLKFA